MPIDMHLQSVFGDDWFALKAEAFARFFGTPSFLITQTVIVAVWILVNVLGLTTFDIYPFILLRQRGNHRPAKCPSRPVSQS